MVDLVQIIRNLHRLVNGYASMNKSDVLLLLDGITEVRVRLYDEPTTFEIWSPQHMEDHNTGYEVQQYLPDYFAIGTDGGLEMLAVHLPSGKVYSIPFVPMECEAGVLVAGSLESLIHQ